MYLHRLWDVTSCFWCSNFKWVSSIEEGHGIMVPWPLQNHHFFDLSEVLSHHIPTCFSIKSSFVDQKNVDSPRLPGSILGINDGQLAGCPMLVGCDSLTTCFLHRHKRRVFLQTAKTRGSESARSVRRRSPGATRRFLAKKRVENTRLIPWNPISIPRNS